MIIKFAYYLKLTMIVALTTVLFAAVEIAPEQPLTFTYVLITVIVANKALWYSAQRSEKKSNRLKLYTRKHKAIQNINSNRAA